MKFTLSKFCAVATLSLAFLTAAKISAATVWLDELDVSKTTQDWGDPQKNKSIDGHPLSIGGEKYEHGLGTHATSTLYIDLKGAKNFSASVGVDDEVNSVTNASIEFSV